MPIFNPSKEHAIYDAVEQAVHLVAPNMIMNKCLRQHLGSVVSTMASRPDDPGFKLRYDPSEWPVHVLERSSGYPKRLMLHISARYTLKKNSYSQHFLERLASLHYVKFYSTIWTKLFIDWRLKKYDRTINDEHNIPAVSYSNQPTLLHTSLIS